MTNKSTSREKLRDYRLILRLCWDNAGWLAFTQIHMVILFLPYRSQSRDSVQDDRDIEPNKMRVCLNQTVELKFVMCNLYT